MDFLETTLKSLLSQCEREKYAKALLAFGTQFDAVAHLKTASKRSCSQKCVLPKAMEQSVTLNHRIQKQI